MKIVVAVISIFILSSCGKHVESIQPDQEDKLYNLNFSIHDFSQIVEPLNSGNLKGSTTTNSVDKLPIDVLEYSIYDSKRVLVASGKNDIVSNSTGVSLPVGFDFKAKLPKGDYHLGVVGYNSKDAGATFKRNQGQTLQSSGGVYFGTQKNEKLSFNEIKNSEVFSYGYGKISLKSDTVLAMLPLKRLTSKLELKILDEIPTDAAFLYIGGVFGVTMSPFQADALTFAAHKMYIPFDTKKDVGNINAVFTTVVMPLEIKTYDVDDDIEIRVYNANYVPIVIKTIPNVARKANHITRLSGKLFDGLPNTSYTGAFKAEIIKEYSPDDIQVGF